MVSVVWTSPHRGKMRVRICSSGLDPSLKLETRKTEIKTKNTIITKLESVQNRDLSLPRCRRSLSIEVVATLIHVMKMKQKRTKNAHFTNSQMVVIPYTLIQEQFTMSPQINTEFFAEDFEAETVGRCNSVLQKVLPQCSFNKMEHRRFIGFQNGRELDGFGYILEDSGMPGVDFAEDGVVLLKFPGGEQQNKTNSPRKKKEKVKVKEKETN